MRTKTLVGSDFAREGQLARDLRDQDKGEGTPLVAALRPVERLMDALPDGIAVISGLGTIVFANNSSRF